jgi:ankyrin repeat protein
LDRGANALAITNEGSTTLLLACQKGANLGIVRRLLAAGVTVDARDKINCTALHHATMDCNVETMRELIVEHNANVCEVGENGMKTPFDLVLRNNSASERYALLIERYGNKLSQEHGRLAHEDSCCRPPLNNLTIRLPLGKLTLQHFRTLLTTLDAELIRNRDDSGKLPIHMACRNKAPVDVLAWIVEHDAATLHIVAAVRWTIPACVVS